MNADQAKAVAAAVGQQLQHEWMTTYKVLAAVPEGKRDYKPEAELAQRLGAGHAHGRRRRLVPRRRARRASSTTRASRRRRRPSRARRLVQEEFPEPPRARARARRRQADPDHRLLRHEDAGGAVHGLRAGAHGASPRPAVHLPAADGRQGAEHLRRQLRRAVAGPQDANA